MRWKTAAALLLAACGGGDGSGAHDGGAPDVDPGAPDAGPSGPVVVEVLWQGEPVVDAQVAVHDPGGAVVASLRTGADGRVTVQVVAGSSVTVGTPPHPGPFDSLLQLVTVAGVEPGDVLRFGSPGAGTTKAAMLDIQPPAGGPAADWYTIDMGCSQTDVAALPALVAVPEGCVRDGRAAIRVVAYLPGGKLLPPEVVGTAWVADIAATGGTTTVTLPDWTLATRTLAVSMLNAPAESQDATFAAVLRHDGRTYASTATFRTTPFVGGVAMSDLLLAVDPSEEVDLELGETAGPSYRWWKDRPAPAPDAVTLDMGAAPLPLLTAFDRDLSDPAHPTVSWAADGDVSAAEAVVITFGWRDPALNNRSTFWIVVSPAGAPSSWSFPSLPEDMAAFRPTGGGGWEASTLTLLDTGETGTYDAVRAELVGPLSRLTREGWEPVTRAAPTLARTYRIIQAMP